MSRRLFALAAIPLALATASCGSSDSGGTAAGGIDATKGGTASVVGSEIQFDSGEFEIPAGESFSCFWTPFTTDKEYSVIKANAVQAAGGHHVTAYTAGVIRDPHMQSCSGTTEMADWSFVIGAGGEGTANDFAALPDGLAIKVPQKKQLLIQIHYINTTGAPMKVRDTMTIVTTDPSNVKDYAADFVIDDDQWELPPHMETTSTMTCTVPEDIQLVMMLGHMHEEGKHYKLEYMEPGETAFKLFEGYEHDWKPAFASHPPTWKREMGTAMKLKKGTKFRQTCTWNNQKSEMLSFPTEMCIGFGYRFPATERMTCDRDK